MTCEQLEELLPLYVDGDASEDEERQIEEHLDRCPDCVATLNYLRRADALVGAWPVVPREMQPRLAQIDARVLPRIQRRRSRFSPVRFVGAASPVGRGAVALVLITALVAMVPILPGLEFGGAPGDDRAAQEAQIRQVAAGFVTAANRTMQPPGTKSQSGASIARARSYLAPRYHAGLADFRRVVNGNGTVLRLGSGRPGTGTDRKALALTMVDGDRAAGYVDVSRLGTLVRVRFGFERVATDWKVARVEATRLGGASATPTLAPAR
jgi:predicted anti-sigma-YlaC factor YlaD